MRYIQFNCRPHIRKLDDLILEARAYAQAALEAVGSVRPTLLAVSPLGVFAHYPERMANEAGKDLFALECRLLLTATRATMCAMILESWFSDIPDGKIPETPPSKAPNRREVVTVSAESRKEQRFLIFPIHRDTAGHFRELEENTAPDGMTTAGRFAQMISPNPSRQMGVDAARRTLNVLGIQLGSDSRGFSSN